MSSVLAFIFVILLAPVAVLLRTGKLLNIPFASRFFIDQGNETHTYDGDIEEALHAFSFDESGYKQRGSMAIAPDKFFYFFTQKKSDSEVLAILVEDFILDLTYVQECFTQELKAELVELCIPTQIFSSKFNERGPVLASKVYTKPQDWENMRKYAIDFSPYYFAFAAKIIPKNADLFWSNLHKRLK